jgi:hypothetical protein
MATGKTPQFDGPLARAARRVWAGVLRHGKPAPWSPELEAAVRDPAAVPLCVNCLFPQEQHARFCPHCGFPGGHYVATMPFLTVFLDGELFRRGVMGPPEKRPVVLVFQALYAAMNYSVFVPIYWFWMVRRALGHPICAERRPELRFESEPGPHGAEAGRQVQNL